MKTGHHPFRLPCKGPEWLHLFPWPLLPSALEDCFARHLLYNTTSVNLALENYDTVAMGERASNHMAMAFELDFQVVLTATGQ